jgi:hypothetical protein
MDSAIDGTTAVLGTVAVCSVPLDASKRNGHMGNQTTAANALATPALRPLYRAIAARRQHHVLATSPSPAHPIV